MIKTNGILMKLNTARKKRATNHINILPSENGKHIIIANNVNVIGVNINKKSIVYVITKLICLFL